MAAPTDRTSSLAAIRSKLEARARAPLRCAKIFDDALTKCIVALDAPDAVKAGLHLWNDDLERSHLLAQEHEGDSTHDYWHAIVHRREGDFSNSQYWLRRVGTHPVLDEVHGGFAGALEFVERCRNVVPEDLVELEGTQRREIIALLAHAGCR